MRHQRRTPTRLTMAHGAMVLAGLATFVTVGAALQERSATVEVLGVVEPVAAGTPATEIEVAAFSIDADSPFLDALIQPGHAPEGLVVARAMVPGDPLVMSNFVEEGDPILTRTATIPVEAIVLDGLGLAIGDRIDVVGIDADGAAGFVAVDVRVSRLPTVRGADGLLLGPTASFVTVEVDDVQAIDIVGARRMGPIDIIRATGAPPIQLSTLTRPTSIGIEVGS